MELKGYLAILWRRKWIIAVTLAVALTVVIIGTLMATPKYVASTTLRIAIMAADGSLDYVDYIYADRLTNTYAEIATSRSVLEEVMGQLGLDEPPKIKTEVIANTELLRIAVEDPNPILAWETANAVAEILVGLSRELYTEDTETAQKILSERLAQVEEELKQVRGEYEILIAQNPEDSSRITAAARAVELKQETQAMLLEQYERARLSEATRANTLSVFEPAVVPRVPSKPSKTVNIALGAMVGLAGGVGLAFLFENLDSMLYTTPEIEEVAAASSIGRIPTARGRQVITFFNGHSPQAEAFRRLRTHTLMLGHDRRLRTLLVTSAEPREGKSTTAANLGFASAQAGRQVIAVDADLRRPTLHTLFGLANEIGLSSVLSGEVTLDEAIQEGNVPGLRVLTSGPKPSDPVDLLGSAEMSALLEQLTERLDLVFVDAPCLLGVTDAVVLTPIVDGVLLVVARARARREAVVAARQQLADARAKWVGLVVNRAEPDDNYQYYLK